MIFDIVLWAIVIMGLTAFLACGAVAWEAWKQMREH